MEVKEGFAAHGLPAGRRELMPPAPIKGSFLRAAGQFFLLLALMLAGICYGLVVSLGRLLSRPFKKPASVRGRVCFVTGSGRGLGRDICLQLARKGAILACADINETINQETVKLVIAIGATAKAYRLNVSDKQAVEAVAVQIEADLGPVYLVVNNAALVLPQTNPTEEFVRASFNVNTLGPYWVMQAFLPLLTARDEGHILTIGSASCFQNFPPLDVYSSTKAALRSLMQAVYCRLRQAKSKVKVSVIHPMLINTSEDYVNALNSVLKFDSTTATVKAVMHAIKYGIFEVNVPSYIVPGLIFMQLLPMECVLFLTNIVNPKAILPSNAEYDNLPSGNIVRLCSGKESTKEETKNGNLK